MMQFGRGKKSIEANNRGSYIDGPLVYLLNTRGSDSYTLFESDCISAGRIARYRVRDDKACSIAAIAACIYANRQEITGELASYDDIYAHCLGAACEKRLYTDVRGTPPFYIDNAARRALKNYGSDWSAKNRYFSPLRFGMEEIPEGRPLIINIAFGYYARHSLTVVGYRRYKNSSGRVYNFFEVKDGWEPNLPRYVFVPSLMIAGVTIIY
ncbi:MAG TPA: hypothetical protein PL035_02220 [Bacillota bacterium]|nr:hypothetical protein [Bacillota bacterium]